MSTLVSKISAMASKFQVFQMFKAGSQAGLLMCGGDLMSQIAIERKKPKDVDIPRTLRFGLVGFVLVGPALFKWYGFLERRITFRHPGARAFGKMMVDQCTFAPVFLYGFFWINGALSRLSPAEINSNIDKKYLDVLVSNYEVWPAVQMFNFWVIPLSQRILFVQTVALFWNTYLAWKINRMSPSLSHLKGGSDETGLPS